MKKILMPLMAATMLVPSMTLASSIRPGTRVTHDTLNSGSSSRSKTLCLNEKEKFAERCEVTIDETGVKGPAGHITNVVQWTKDQKEFSYGGAAAGSGLSSIPFVGWVLAGAASMIGMNEGAEIGGSLAESFSDACVEDIDEI